MIDDSGFRFGLLGWDPLETWGLPGTQVDFYKKKKMPLAKDWNPVLQVAT